MVRLRTWIVVASVGFGERKYDPSHQPRLREIRRERFTRTAQGFSDEQIQDQESGDGVDDQGDGQEESKQAHAYLEKKNPAARFLKIVWSEAGTSYE